MLTCRQPRATQVLTIPSYTTTRLQILETDTTDILEHLPLLLMAFMSSLGPYLCLLTANTCRLSLLNSQPVGASFVQGTNDYSSVTGTAILSMQKNDIVFTRTHATYFPHGSIRGDNLMRTAFTGWWLSLEKCYLHNNYICFSCFTCTSFYI